MIKKICAVFAVMACGLMIGNVNSVAWADVSVEKTDDDYSDVGVRSPRTIEGVPIDDGHKRDVNWDAKKKELTLNNYHGKGYIILDDLERNSNNNEIDSKREEAERLAHKNDVITIVVKGDCTIEGCLECECNLKITGDGSLSVIDEGEKDSEYEGTYTICTGDYFASDFSPAKFGNI